MRINQKLIGKGWSLFLDRDGVINKRIPDDYVMTHEQFDFIPGVLKAFPVFASHFGRIVVVSNQQGVGKGLMTEEMLNSIHRNMIDTISKSGGRIDKVYYCPHLKESGSFMRKPNIGMGLAARKDFPDIHFSRSVMAGDSLSDMRFGKRLGMLTVFISNDLQEIRSNPGLIDHAYPDLCKFADSLLNT